MTDDDRDTFGQRMWGISEVFNEPMTLVRIEGYFAALIDLPVDVVLRGIAEVTRRHTIGFPRPAEIRSAALGNAGDQAELAWSEVVVRVRKYGA